MDLSMNIGTRPEKSRACNDLGFSYPVGPMPSHMPTCPYQPPAPLENAVSGTSDTQMVAITESAGDINARNR